MQDDTTYSDYFENDRAIFIYDDGIVHFVDDEYCVSAFGRTEAIAAARAILRHFNVGME